MRRVLFSLQFYKLFYFTSIFHYVINGRSPEINTFLTSVTLSEVASDYRVCGKVECRIIESQLYSFFPFMMVFGLRCFLVFSDLILSDSLSSWSLCLYLKFRVHNFLYKWIKGVITFFQEFELLLGKKVLRYVIIFVNHWFCCPETNNNKVIDLIKVLIGSNVV